MDNCSGKDNKSYVSDENELAIVLVGQQNGSKGIRLRGIGVVSLYWEYKL